MPKRTKSERNLLADMAEFEEEWEREVKNKRRPNPRVSDKESSRYWFMLAKGWNEKCGRQ